MTVDNTMVKTKRVDLILIFFYIILSFYEAYINQYFGAITKYYILLIAFVFYVKSYHIIRITKINALLIVWFLYKMFSIVWAINSSVYSVVVLKNQFISHIGMLALLLILTGSTYSRTFVKKIIKMIMYISASMGLLGLFFSQPYHDVGSSSRLVLNIFGKEVDPNNMAAFYLPAIAIALYYVIFEYKKHVLNFIIIGINTFSLFLTASRGGFVSLLGIIFILVLMSEKKIRISTFLLKIFTLSLLVVVLYFLIISFAPGSSVHRLFSIESYAGGAHRDVLWSKAVELFFEHPVFGIGWGGTGFGIHNTFITVVTETGIIGFALFSIPFACLCFRAVKSRDPLVLIILAIGFFPSFFIDAINKRFFWNAIIFSIMLMNSKDIDQNENNIRVYY